MSEQEMFETMAQALIGARAAINSLIASAKRRHVPAIALEGYQRDLDEIEKVLKISRPIRYPWLVESEAK